MFVACSPSRIAGPRSVDAAWAYGLSTAAMISERFDALND